MCLPLYLFKFCTLTALPALLWPLPCPAGPPSDPWASGSHPAALLASELSVSAAPSPVTFLPGKKIMQLRAGSRRSGSRVLVIPAHSATPERGPSHRLTGSLAPWTKDPGDSHSCISLTLPPRTAYSSPGRWPPARGLDVAFLCHNTMKPLPQLLHVPSPQLFYLPHPPFPVKGTWPPPAKGQEPPSQVP